MEDNSIGANTGISSEYQPSNLSDASTQVTKKIPVPDESIKQKTLSERTISAHDSDSIISLDDEEITANSSKNQNNLAEVNLKKQQYNKDLVDLLNMSSKKWVAEHINGIYKCLNDQTVAQQAAFKMFIVLEGKKYQVIPKNEIPENLQEIGKKHLTEMLNNTQQLLKDEPWDNDKFESKKNNLEKLRSEIADLDEFDDLPDFDDIACFICLKFNPISKKVEITTEFYEDSDEESSIHTTDDQEVSISIVPNDDDKNWYDVNDDFVDALKNSTIKKKSGSVNSEYDNDFTN